MVAKKTPAKKTPTKQAEPPKETGVLTYDNRAKYGVMPAATESERPAMRQGERRGNTRAARSMKRR